MADDNIPHTTTRSETYTRTLIDTDLKLLGTLEWKYDDNYLRKVETNTLIPKMMREKAKNLCKEYEEAYVECCRNHKVLLFWKCQPQNKAFNECLIKQYEDPSLRESCTKQYLEERAQFRLTGIPAKKSKRAQKIEEFQKQKLLQQQKAAPGAATQQQND